jgi:hypothetical protein
MNWQQPNQLTPPQAQWGQQPWRYGGGLGSPQGHGGFRGPAMGPQQPGALGPHQAQQTPLQQHGWQQQQAGWRQQQPQPTWQQPQGGPVTPGRQQGGQQERAGPAATAGGAPVVFWQLPSGAASRMKEGHAPPSGALGPKGKLFTDQAEEAFKVVDGVLERTS